MAHGETLPDSVGQILNELVRRGAIRLQKTDVVGGHARGARPRSPIIYIDDKFVDARPDVQRFLLAHEIPRLELGKPRLPAIRALAGAGVAYAVLVPTIIVVA